MIVEADVLLAAALDIAAVAAVRRLTIFHPAAIWLAAWATATTLFALRGLPYRPLSTETVLIIAGWSALFCVGTLAGERVHVPALPPRRAARIAAGPRSVETAAVLAAILTVIGLAAFLVEVASRFGLRAALVSDIQVRFEIAAGATPYTIKYVYCAFAAAALAGLAAGRARSEAARRWWMLLALAMVASMYFSTGRSNVVLAGVTASIAFFLADQRAISPRRVLLVGAVSASAALAVYFSMGSLLQKSFSSLDISTFDNAFLRHDTLRPLASPYQYLTAPLPGFEIVRRVTPSTGRGGCRTLSPACAVGEKLGLPVKPAPSLTGFTAAPSSWNTFTALYGPLVDAGALLGGLIMLAQGLLFGSLWAAARRGSPFATCAYAVSGCALLYSTVQNTLLLPHLIGAAAIAGALIAAAGAVERRAAARRPPSLEQPVSAP